MVALPVTKASYFKGFLSKGLSISLFLMLFVPPLFILPGRYHGKWIFVNYEEPKFVAVQVLCWLFLSFFWLNLVFSNELEEGLRRVARDKWLHLLVLFFIYLCLTTVNSLVVEASLYELFQYFTLINVVIALGALTQDARWLRLAMLSICSSFVVMVALGYCQMFVDIPWLEPIRSGALFPSTMGYKNPAGLSVTAQWFLLAGLVYDAFEKGRRRWGVVGVLLLMAEAGYIAAIQSRTSYLGFTVGIILLFVFFLLAMVRRGWSVRRVGAVTLALFLVAFLVFAAVLKLYPRAHGRFLMAIKYIKTPSAFLNCDRGTYLRNSIIMANSKLLGVGIGNWAFAYPIMRKVNPGLCFNRGLQVTRAHGDYAQMLGEAGWPGLLLWALLFGWVAIHGLRTAFSSSNPLDLFVVIQLCVFMTLMLTDYVIQMAYHKFALFVLLAMVEGRRKI